MIGATYRLLAALVLLLVVFLGGLRAEAYSVEERPPTEVCYEDEACWDWRYMGNRSAGFPFHDLSYRGVVRYLGDGLWMAY